MKASDDPLNFTMKKSTLILCFLLPLGGCGGEQADPNAPEGMQSALAHIEINKMLYTREGKEFGTVTDVEQEHKFPDGTTKPAVKIDVAGDGSSDSLWMVREKITSNYYVKK